jgi:hypothetical protein
MELVRNSVQIFHPSFAPIPKKVLIYQQPYNVSGNSFIPLNEANVWGSRYLRYNGPHGRGYTIVS